MPYLITTRTPRGPVGPIDQMSPSEQTAALEWQRGADTSRRAVATLDEARNVVWSRIAFSDEWEGHMLPLDDPNYPGGTIALPDGTVIEVERVELTTLATGWTVALTDEAGTIDAFNAAQESDDTYLPGGTATHGFDPTA